MKGNSLSGLWSNAGKSAELVDELLYGAAVIRCHGVRSFRWFVDVAVLVVMTGCSGPTAVEPLAEKAAHRAQSTYSETAHSLLG